MTRREFIPLELVTGGVDDDGDGSEEHKTGAREDDLIYQRGHLTSNSAS